MIISHRHKFVYIKPAKTAGTSIQVALSQVVGPDDIVLGPCAGYCQPQNIEKFHRPGEKHHGHQSLGEVFQQVPECQDYFVFISERNSWDKMVSRFFSFVERTVPLREQFERWLTSNPKLNHIWYRADMYLHHRPDFVIQYHNLQDDWYTLQELLNLELPTLTHRRGKSRPDISYTLCHTEVTKQLVAETFQPQIDMYGYCFGEQDTHVQVAER